MSVEATTDRNRILLRGTTFSQKNAAKAIAGCQARWDKSFTPNKFIGWSYPLTMETCYALRRVFGRELIVHPALTQWAREALQKQEVMEGIRAGGTIALTHVQEAFPNMYQAMAARPYQPVGSSFMLEGQHTLLGDDPGLGKTIQTLAALVQAQCRRILVACPKTTTRSVWCNETNFWTPAIMPFVAQGREKQREQVIQEFNDTPYDGPKMLIINTEMLRAKRIWECPNGRLWDAAPNRKGGCRDIHNHETVVEYLWPELFEQKWDAVVLDESHQLLASRYNFMSKNITQGRLGAVHLRRMVKPGGLAIALSGTPFRSDLTKAWGTLNWLQPDVFPSFWNWAREHFPVDEEEIYVRGGTKQQTYTLRVDEESGVPEPRNMEKFNAAMRPYFLARTKAEAAPDLPPVQYMGTSPADNPDGLKAIWLEMEPKQAAAYNQMKNMAEAELEGGKLLATGVLAEITRLRQFASTHGRMADGEFVPGLPSNKIEWLLEFLMEQAGHDTKVVFASEFTQLVNLTSRTIQKELSQEVLTITGDVTGGRRDRAVERFQNMSDPCKVMGLNVKAGGVGITLDAADYMVLLDVPWTSDTEEQVVNRVHRVSRIHNVMVYRLLSVGTVDEWMGGLTEAQRRILMSASGAASMAMEALHGQ
jgi:SNF2 family DNA or RNA helicase